MSSLRSASVLMPTYQGAEFLDRVLGALAAQNYGGTWDFWAVDSGSTDGTLSILERHRARFPVPFTIRHIKKSEFNHGDTRNYCTALIAMDEEAIRTWAQQHGITGSYAELAKNARVQALFQSAIDELNAELPSFSTIKKFTLLPADLTEAAGDLTPSQKLKRKAVQAKYKSLLDAMY